ncbi:hypothetical protein [Acrocarpospora sp. B8E8]|uniref:hypothetical protein n=1 Tax=Acrocarpospora sp. B8E8 TaxID=3153572 RepID=UPI00325DA0E5
MISCRTVVWCAGLGMAAFSVAGCATDDEIYVSSFVYTSQEPAGLGDSRDVDVSQLDCEYPPPGQRHPMDFGAEPSPPTTA